MSRNSKKSWLNAVEAAEYLCLSFKSFNGYVEKGFVPFSRPGGSPKGRRRFARADLDELMAANRQEATAGVLARSKP